MRLELDDYLLERPVGAELGAEISRELVKRLELTELALDDCGPGIRDGSLLALARGSPLEQDLRGRHALGEEDGYRGRAEPGRERLAVSEAAESRIHDRSPVLLNLLGGEATELLVCAAVELLTVVLGRGKPASSRLSFYCPGFIK